MARKSSGQSEASGFGMLLLFAFVAVVALIKFIIENIVIFIIVFAAIIAAIALFVARNNAIEERRKELLREILVFLHMENIGGLIKNYDDRVVVKSRQALDNYSDLKYLKDFECLEDVERIVEKRKQVKSVLSDFLRENDFEDRPEYDYVQRQLNDYINLSNGYRAQIVYITSAGNNKGQRTICISESRVKEIKEHPEYLMSKSEYNKLQKQLAKDELEDKKHAFYDKVNEIIDYANESKGALIVKSEARALDSLVQNLFDRTINSIQKIKQIDSAEWDMLEGFISSTDERVRQIILNDKRINDYYESEDFARLKEACELLTQSRKDFNDYIEEKAQSISQLFGTRVVRNETQQEDIYNYIRAYKKSVTPFTAEVSYSVFGSAENDPMTYIVKYFYPNKSLYKEQIQKLRILIEELETLKEAKIIIDNYKKEYEQYIQNVPDYVLENDEDGFYSRLGLAILDEAILNVEYKFVYTSNGGMAQRSFTVPMNEENIIELINTLESKLSAETLAKEQRALMTSKLRMHIKERDNFTCCQCGNSINAEPNLLLEVDHIVPIAKGGLTREDNLQTLCWKCNRKKGAKLISVF